jgi:hypothetical protein
MKRIWTKCVDLNIRLFAFSLFEGKLVRIVWLSARCVFWQWGSEFCLIDWKYIRVINEFVGISGKFSVFYLLKNLYVFECSVNLLCFYLRIFLWVLCFFGIFFSTIFLITVVTRFLKSQKIIKPNFHTFWVFTCLFTFICGMLRIHWSLFIDWIVYC